MLPGLNWEFWREADAEAGVVEVDDEADGLAIEGAVGLREEDAAEVGVVAIVSVVSRYLFTLLA